MTVQVLLIGLAAGAAAALLFASVVSGSVFALALFSLAALPLMIAAIGWSHVAALVAAVTAAAGLALVLGPYLFIGFLVGVGLPAWWLGYLTLLARPVETQAGEAIEWYPVGHLVVWAAILGGVIVLVAIPNFGVDAESFRAGLRRVFERVLRMQTGTPSTAPLQLPGFSDTNSVLDLLVLVIPPAAAVLTMLTNLVNLWLAALIVRFSGRLKRPRPDIAAMTFPAYAPALLALAVAATFLPGLVSVGGSVLSACLLAAYALLGLAVMHMLTRGMNGRVAVLTGTYVTLGLFGWPILMLALLGLIETAFGLRARRAAKRGPPARPA